MRMALNLCGPFPQNSKSQSNEKYARQIRIERPSTEHLAITVQKCQGHEKLEKTEKLSQIGED